MRRYFPKPVTILRNLSESGPSETRQEALRLLTLPDLPESFLDCARKSRRGALRILACDRSKSAKARLAALKELCWGVLPEADTESDPNQPGPGSQDAPDMIGVSSELRVLLAEATEQDTKRDRRELEKIKTAVANHQGECADELKTLCRLLDSPYIGKEVREYAEQIRPSLSGYQVFLLSGGRVFVSKERGGWIAAAYLKEIAEATGIPYAVVAKLGHASLDDGVREFVGTDYISCLEEFIKAINTAYSFRPSYILRILPLRRLFA